MRLHRTCRHDLVEHGLGNRLLTMSTANDSESEFIIETDDASFESDVFERSKELPVVVDFWAAWCGPCKVLAPVLESLAKELKGKFVLVKADTDHVPKAASEFQVQGIPAVYAVCEGEVVDYFQGALPEPQVRQWLDQVFLRQEFLRAEKLESDDLAAAADTYRSLLERMPDAVEIQIGLARVHVQLKEYDQARTLLEQLERRGFLEPEAEAVKSQLELSAAATVDLDSLRAAAASDPENSVRALELARGLAAHEEHVEAMEMCLEVIQRDKQASGDEARDLMVDILRVVPDEELVRDYRRKLSMALY